MSMYRAKFPGSYDPRLKATVRLDKLHHQNESDGYVTQYQNGLGWQAVAPYQISTTSTVEVTATGTYTPSSNLVYADVTCIASGGGGGGVASGGATIGAGAGAGGGSSKRSFLAAEIGTSQSVTVNNGGAAGADTGGDGGDGGTVSFGSLLSATGGKGGKGSTSGTYLGGIGGIGSGTGASLYPGGNGETGVNIAASERGGYGGASLGGAGGAPGGIGAGNNGVAGTRGSGGGGALGNAGNAGAGGAGGKGLVVIVEYLS